MKKKLNIKYKCFHNKEWVAPVAASDWRQTGGAPLQSKSTPTLKRLHNQQLLFERLHNQHPLFERLRNQPPLH